jgi:hypothetical protein
MATATKSSCFGLLSCSPFLFMGQSGQWPVASGRLRVAFETIAHCLPTTAGHCLLLHSSIAAVVRFISPSHTRKLLISSYDSPLWPPSYKNIILALLRFLSVPGRQPLQPASSHQPASRLTAFFQRSSRIDVPSLANPATLVRRLPLVKVPSDAKDGPPANN